MSGKKLATRDCIIVGGGAIGMLTARELARNGLTVTLVERGETGRESSWAGGGILSPLYPWRYPDAVNTLAALSQTLYQVLAEELMEATGIDPEWNQCGCLMLGVPDEDKALSWAAARGIELERLNEGTQFELEPELSRLIHGTHLWMPRIAQIRNPRLVKALKSSLNRLKVEILEGTSARELWLRDDKVLGVRSDLGNLRAGQVIVAAGAWSAGLLGSLDSSLEITPVRGQMILFRGPVGLVRRIVMTGSHYLIPRRDGRVLAGSTVEYVGFDKSTTQTAREELSRAASTLIPALGRYDIECHWAGLRPGAPEGIPFIGPHPSIQGLYVNAGHYRNGLTLGPASARLLTDLILGREPSLDPDPYSLNAKRSL